MYDTNAIKEKIRDQIERYLAIEDVLGLENEFSFGYENAVLTTSSDVKAQAVRLRKEWGLGEDAINDVQATLENHAVKVIDIDAPEGFDGLSGVVNGKYPVIVLNRNISQSERRRMTALHELAHILFNQCFDPLLTTRQKESLCTVFANEMLLPSSVFLKVIGANRKDISLNELIDLQIIYGISIDAMMMKAKELNVITEQRCRTYFIKKNQNEVFRNMVVDSRFDEPGSNRFLSLVYKAVASEFITVSKAASLLSSTMENVRNQLNLV